MTSKAKYLRGEIVLSALFFLLWSGAAWYAYFRHLVPFASTPLGGDAQTYSDLAVSLLRHGTYSLDGVTLFTDREPGYSLFVAVVYGVFGVGRYWAVYVMQTLLYAVASLALVRTLRTHISARASLIILAILFTSPTVFRGLFVLDRELFALSMAMFFSVYCFKLHARGTWVHAALAGMFLGGFILAYMPFLLFPVVLIPLFLLWKVRVRLIVLTLGVAAVLVVPWGVRNFLASGHACLTGCARSSVCWYVRGEQAEHVRGWEPLRCLWSEYVTRDWTGRSPDCSFNAVKNRIWDTPVMQDTDALTREAFAKIRRNFPWYLWFSVFEVVEFHLPYVGGWGWWYNLLTAFGVGVLYVGCALGAASLRRARLWLFALLPLYAVTLFALTDATPRYALPVFFCYAVFAGLGYDRALARVWRR